MRFTCVVVLVSLGLLVKSTDACAQVELSDTTTMYRVDSEVEVLIDSTGILTFDDVRKLTFPKSNGAFTFGYLKKPIWLRINAHTIRQNTLWYLEIPAPFIEYVDFYQKTGATSATLPQWLLLSPKWTGYITYQSCLAPLVRFIEQQWSIYSDYRA